jgi:virginiamycin B lyase
MDASSLPYQPEQTAMTKTNFSGLAAIVIPVAALGSLATVALAQNLPPGNGKEVVESVCGGCHDLTPITESVGFSREDWDMVVQSMIAMGAVIKPEQASLITTYLAQNFPPKPKR